MPRLIDANRIVYAWTIDNDGEEHDGVTLQSIIDKMPTVDAEPVRHGHWEQMWEDENQIQARCSCCGVVFWIGKGRDGNYCPNCGAKMDEEEK